MSLEEDLWSNLPSDILDIILWRLPLLYHPRFASVCKNWNAVCTHKLYLIKHNDPLLVHVKSWKSGILNYYSPVYNKTFKIKSALVLSESCFFSTKDGWLVLYKKVVEEEEEIEVVLTNPATKVSYSYPGLPRDYLFTGITFAGCPGTEDLVIFCIASEEWRDNCVSISVWKQGRWKLPVARYYNQTPFSMSPCSSPVAYKGCFYCMSESGKLGVFNPEKETWNILTNPKRFPIPTSCKEVYLIESENKIMAVVGGNHDPRLLLVFYLDCDMVWKNIKSLETRSMFVGPKASIMLDFSEENDANEEGKTNKELDANKKGKATRKEVDDNKKEKASKKVDVNGVAMKNRVYTTRIHGKIEVLEAEMKTSEKRLFFVSNAACGHSENKDGSKNGNIVSYSMQSRKVDKYYGSSQYLYCAWYKPGISCSLQDQ